MLVRYILSSVCLRLKLFSQLSFIQHFMLSAFSLCISLSMIVRIFWTPSHYHHQIGNMNQPSFRVRSLKNGTGCTRCYEEEPTNNKGINGLLTSRLLPSIVCLMVVTRYVCCVIWFMRIIIASSRRRDSMIVADGLAPIWRQDIRNHHDGEGLSMCLMNIPKWRCLAMTLQNQNRAQQNRGHILWDVL